MQTTLFLLATLLLFSANIVVRKDELNENYCVAYGSFWFNALLIIFQLIAIMMVFGLASGLAWYWKAIIIAGVYFIIAPIFGEIIYSILGRKIGGGITSIICLVIGVFALVVSYFL